MNFDLIPWDLKTCPNWVNWRYEQRGGAKPTKVPINPTTGGFASTSDPTTWASFDAALANCSDVVGLGFVFTNSPFAGIDLDYTENSELLQWHANLARILNSYAERSPSGKGLHIIVRGSVPSGKKDTVKACEVYSEGRFFTVTGDVYHNVPIAERQAALMDLWREIGGNQAETPTDVGRGTESRTDDEIVALAMQASNGAKFRKLWTGDLTDHNGDHSAGDQALMNLLAFYTPSADQVVRIFRRSALGQRDKAGRADYVQRTVSRAYDQGADLGLGPVEAFKVRCETPVENSDFEDEVLLDESVRDFELTPDDSIPWPPGAVGRLAAEIYDMSLFPRRRVSIGAALSIMGMMCGRNWHVGSMGLNLYTILLGKTGLGKQDGINGVFRTFQQLDQVRQMLNQDAQFVPKLRKKLVSEPGMHRDMVEHHSMLYVIDEVQIKLASMLSAHSSSPDYGIKSFLTANYTESGPYGQLGKATYSKKENSLDGISRPNLNFFGLGVPGGFWSAVNYEHLQDGFLNRLLLMECPEHEDSTRNRTPASKLSDELVNVLSNIAVLGLQADGPLGQSIAVRVPEVIEELDIQNSEYYRLNGSDTAKYAQARVAMNTMKIASLFAIGDNPGEPIITEHGYNWAHRLVTESAKRMILKFDRGETGHGDAKCAADLRWILSDYFNPKGKWQIRPESKSMNGAISYRHISQYAAKRQAFTGHTKGFNTAVELTIKRLTDEGVLVPTVVGRRGGRYFNLGIRWSHLLNG